MRQRAERQNRLHEGRVACARVLVAVPPAIGPLPMQQSLDEVVRSIVGNVQLQYRPQRIGLLRRAAPITTLHERHAILSVDLALRLDLELSIEPFAQPLFLQLVANRNEVFVGHRVTDVGQRRHHPVGALPLRIDVRSNLSVRRAPLKQRRDERRSLDFIAQRSDGLRIRILSEESGSDLEADGGLVGLEQRLDDCVGLHLVLLLVSRPSALVSRSSYRPACRRRATPSAAR